MRKAITKTKMRKVFYKKIGEGFLVKKSNYGIKAVFCKTMEEAQANQEEDDLTGELYEIIEGFVIQYSQADDPDRCYEWGASYSEALAAVQKRLDEFDIKAIAVFE